MATPRAADEASIRRLIGRLAEAIRAMDLEALRACFAPDMVSFRKIDGTWFIAHDQVSVPADFASGRALLNLEP